MTMLPAAVLMYRFYSDYDDDDDDDDDEAGPDAGGDVISIHDDDSEPEPESSEPATKHCRLSDDVVAAPVTTGPEAGSDVAGVMMMEYWTANSYSGLSLAGDDTSDADVMFAECPQLRDVACLVVDLRPGEMIYLPASWLYQVTSRTNSSLSTVTCSIQWVTLPFA